MKRDKYKRIIDVLLLVALVITAGTALNNPLIHECAGIPLIILVLVHLYMNFDEIKRSWKPKSGYFVALSIINLALIIVFIIMGVCGVLLSDFFSFRSVSIIRQLHIALSFWFLVLSGIHLGFNWVRFIPKKIALSLKHSKLRPYLLTLAFSVALYGAWVFNAEGILNIMFGTATFLDYAFYKNLVFSLFNAFSMLSLWTFLGYQIGAFLRRKRS